MDLFQKWTEFWHPVAKPTADLATEAQRKYDAGEIDQATYLAAIGKNQKLVSDISAAKSDYVDYAAKNSLAAENVLKPVKDLLLLVVIVVVVIGGLQLLSQLRVRGWRTA